jgi:hypothetical protein
MQHMSCRMVTHMSIFGTSFRAAFPFIHCGTLSSSQHKHTEVVANANDLAGCPTIHRVQIQHALIVFPQQMDHAGHDHSAHAAAAPLMPGKIAHPAHGTWPGHVLPGSFFVVWSTWWLISIFRYVPLYQFPAEAISPVLATTGRLRCEG